MMNKHDKHADQTPANQFIENLISKKLLVVVGLGLVLSLTSFAIIKYGSISTDLISWLVLGAGVVTTLLIGKCISVLINNTEAAEHTAAEQDIYLEAIIENMPSMVFVKDSKELRFVRFNKAGEKLTGISRQEMLGKNDYDFFPKEQADSFTKADQAVLASGDVKVIDVEELDTPFGQRLLRTKKVAVTMPNGEKFLLGISDDITKEKEAAAERESLIKELFQSNEELERFAYIASHDLKSPLRSIDQLASWIEEDLGEDIDEESKENMQMLRGRVARLNRLLDDLLEYSKVGRDFDGLDNPTMNCKELIEDVVQMLGVSPKMKVTYDEDLESIRLRKIPLHQVFYNLINNSEKHHHKKRGHINIQVKEDKEFYEFSITDDGPGIAEEFHEKVFKMFHTLKPRDKVEGSGMGLAMVKKIVNNAGGDIAINSSKQAGLTITFTWPK